MTDFNAFAPNYSASAYPLAGFHGPNSKGREGRGGEGEGMGGREGEGVGEEREGMSGFSLSRPVNHKHNPCTCRMMFRCCPAMAREQILTESISLPDNLRHLDLSLGQFRRALKTHLF